MKRIPLPLLIGTPLVVLLLLLLAYTSMYKNEPLTVGGDEEIIGTEEVWQPMPAGEVAHPEHGKQTYFSYGAIAGTEEVPANGVAYGRMFENDMYFHTLNVNIYPAEEGSFYQAWLSNDSGEYIKTDRLYNRFGDARYSLTFEVERDLTAYKNIVISVETSDSVTSPTKIIGTGMLKESTQ